MLTPAEELKLLSLASAGILPAGATGNVLAQTFDRKMGATATTACVSGTLTMVAILLPAGMTVTGITFVSGTTAEAGGTHLWYALYRGDNLALMAQSADDTGAASLAANTALRKALTTPQVLPYTGLYYLAFLCTATTMPTHMVQTSTAFANGGTGMTPVLAGTSNTGLTATAPAVANAPTAANFSLYAFVD